jgi:hypothetical protein
MPKPGKPGFGASPGVRPNAVFDKKTRRCRPSPRFVEAAGCAATIRLAIPALRFHS